MSHTALVWLATVPADLTNSTEFRVLFHLCNCHNSKTDLCNPTQALLSKRVGVTRSTVNAALSALEARGLVERHQSVDDARRQRPTTYSFAFDRVFAVSGEQDIPVSGQSDTERAEPCPKSTPSRVRSAGHGAVSDLTAEPCPKSAQSRVRPVGHKPVNKSKNNPQAGAPAHEGARDAAPSSVDLPAFWAEKLNTGKFVASSAISAGLAREMLNRNLVTHDRLRAAGIVV